MMSYENHFLIHLTFFCCCNIIVLSFIVVAAIDQSLKFITIYLLVCSSEALGQHQIGHFFFYQEQEFLAYFVMNIGTAIAISTPFLEFQWNDENTDSISTNVNI